MYKATSGQPGAEAGAQAGPGPDAGQKKDEGQVIDAEYVDVDDKK
jgi:hypothetical protein